MPSRKSSNPDSFASLLSRAGRQWRRAADLRFPPSHRTHPPRLPLAHLPPSPPPPPPTRPPPPRRARPGRRLCSRWRVLTVLPFSARLALRISAPAQAQQARGQAAGVGGVYLPVSVFLRGLRLGLLPHGPLSYLFARRP